jgi:hypothetical protein
MLKLIHEYSNTTQGLSCLNIVSPISVHLVQCSSDFVTPLDKRMILGSVRNHKSTSSSFEKLTPLIASFKGQTCGNRSYIYVTVVSLI